MSSIYSLKSALFDELSAVAAVRRELVLCSLFDAAFIRYFRIIRRIIDFSIFRQRRRNETVQNQYKPVMKTGMLAAGLNTTCRR